MRWIAGRLVGVEGVWVWRRAGRLVLIYIMKYLLFEAVDTLRGLALDAGELGADLRGVGVAHLLGEGAVEEGGGGGDDVVHAVEARHALLGRGGLAVGHVGAEIARGE